MFYAFVFILLITWFYQFLILLWSADAAPGISASPSEDNMRYFNVMILGPTQSPYEGSFGFGSIIFLPSNTSNLYCFKLHTSNVGKNSSRLGMFFLELGSIWRIHVSNCVLQFLGMTFCHRNIVLLFLFFSPWSLP